MTERELTRRRLLELGLALPPLAALGGTLTDEARAAPLPLAPTPAIADADEPTPELTEGPYFTPNSPRRRSIVIAGSRGTRLTLGGRVLTTAGRPVPRALVDFWQCDAGGAYDNEGYRFRGHQLTDAKGRYTLFTVVPGLYPGRTKHIHVKVQAPGEAVLTTQLFFPGVSRNASDGIYDPECLIRGWRVADGRRMGRFDFVLDL
jgi:protocatechuate 3,4-dioxygenase beta subunit